MKFFKFIYVLFITVSITSCSSTTEPEPFNLDTANLAGNYTMNSLNSEEIESATSAAGVTVELSKNNKNGDTFQISFIINANGTYTALGVYRSTSVVTPTPDDGQSGPEIITINSSGTYELNTFLNTVNFTQESGDFINGTYDITSFNENAVIINQEVTTSVGGINNEIKTTISLNRN